MNPNRLERLPWREIDGHAVIIHPKRGEVHELNPVGTYLWRLADGTRAIEEVARLTSDEFEISPENALTDVTEFYTELRKLELVNW